MLGSLNEIQAALIDGSITTLELVNQYLEKCNHINDLNAFVEVWKESSILQAKNIDDKIKSGKPLGKLYGAVFTIKDNICYAGHKASAGSMILKDYKSPYSATVVERLLNEDGIIIGSTNCDEFGMGSSSTNSIYGSVKNGKKPTHTAGGSSGGAAVSVQMDTCLFALGSDTGGSIRQPAALCDLFGFKPSYGKVSRHGLIAYASSFDQIGVITKDYKGILTVLEVISGKDGFDSTVYDFIKDQSPLDRSPKIACFNEVKEKANDFVNATLEALQHKVGKNLSYLDFDFLEFLVPCYYILTTAEASSNLSRYDGVRYGHRTIEPKNIEDMYRLSRTEGFGFEVKKRIMLGTFVLSEGYFDAFYGQAQKVRRMIKDAVDSILNEYDVIALPVTTSPPWPLDQKNSDPIEVYLSDIFTVLANLTGMPSISIPITSGNGTVYNVQFLAKQGQDELLLEMIKEFA